MKMRIHLFLMTICVIWVGALEKFCVRERKLLLAGVFNYENILFAYSWKDVHDFQQQIVWRFQITDSQLIEMGNSLTVEQVFPGVPLFKAGFGLSLKCGKGDHKCIAYNKLVFVFFQTYYKVLRFIGDRFADEPDPSKIPWGLKTKGDTRDFGFKNYNLENIYAAAFVPGYQSQIFIVSNSILYKSAVDIRAPSLKWLKLGDSNIFGSVLGAFISGQDLIFNQNLSPDGMLLMYDQNGKETKNTTVWSYFGCKVTDEKKSEPGAQEESKSKKGVSKKRLEVEETNNRYAAIMLSVIIIAIIVSNTSAALFWATIGKPQQSRPNLNKQNP